MPYRKFIKRLKPRRVARKPWYMKKYSVGQVAQKAWSGLKYIKSLINVEQKFFDVTRNNSVQTSTATVLNLSNLAQGNDYNNRDGNSILIQSLLIRYILAGNVSNSLGDIVRIILFQDNDQRGVDPTASDLLEDTSTPHLQMLSPLNHNVGKRFNVISDKIIPVNSQNTVLATGPYYKAGKLFKKFSGNHIKYTSTAGADASNYEGSLYLMTFSLQSVNGPALSIQSRLRFTDN